MGEKNSSQKQELGDLLSHIISPSCKGYHPFWTQFASGILSSASDVFRNDVLDPEETEPIHMSH